MSIGNGYIYDDGTSFTGSGRSIEDIEEENRRLNRIDDTVSQPVTTVDVTGGSNDNSDFTFNYDFGGENSGLNNSTFFDPYSVATGFDPSTAGASFGDNTLTANIESGGAPTVDPFDLFYSGQLGDRPVPGPTLQDWLKNTGIADFAKSAGKTVKELFDKYVGAKALFAGLGGLAGYLDKAPPSGGGYTKRVIGATPYKKTTVQGPRGPIVKYAADGGLMSVPSYQQARMIRPVMMNTPNGPVAGYAAGGPVRMEDGGFVMTKKAVDGAGGEAGIKSLIPSAQMIRGPGTGTSDSIPAVIEGNGVKQPAALSNGEAYVPKQEVQAQGGPNSMYALMHNLQRRG
jgi:hypothetical protein